MQTRCYMAGHLVMLCSLSSQNISEMFLHKNLFLVSSLCLTGDVKYPVFPPCGKEGQRDMSSMHAPLYQYCYKWDQSPCTPKQLVGRAAAVAKATNLLSSTVPAEGNQPKKKIIDSSW